MPYRRAKLNIVRFNTREEVFTVYEDLMCTINHYGVGLISVHFKPPGYDDRTLCILDRRPGVILKSQFTYSMWTESPEKPDMEAFKKAVTDGLTDALVKRRDKAYKMIYDAVETYYRHIDIIGGDENLARATAKEKLEVFPFPVEEVINDGC